MILNGLEPHGYRSHLPRLKAWCPHLLTRGSMGLFDYQLNFFIGSRLNTALVTALQISF